MKGGRELLQLARRAIETRFTKKELDVDRYRKYNEEKGVFVTLTKDGELRGCIGYPVSKQPLYKSVILAARAAAFDDPRFPPLEPEELGEIRVEVTILTEPQQLVVSEPEEYKKKITVGRDGLTIKNGFHQGLLLPQVPTEYGWNIDTYLEHLCMKAGLPRDAWKDKKTKIETFQGKIYSEDT